MVGGGDSAMEEATSWPSSPTRSPSCTAATSSARRKIMIDYARVQGQRRVRHQRRRRRGAGRAGRQGDRCRAARHRHRRAPRAAGATACSWPSATTPRRALFKGILDMDEAGYLITQAGLHRHQRRGRLRRRRRRRPHLPAGRDRRRDGLHGGARRRALAGAQGAQAAAGRRDRSRPEPIAPGYSTFACATGSARTAATGPSTRTAATASRHQAVGCTAVRVRLPVRAARGLLPAGQRRLHRLRPRTPASSRPARACSS